MAIDLHVHSSASDGEFSPGLVVERAQAVGLKTIALTDHDTVAGCREAAAAGYERGVRVIAGCEFSVAAPWGEMHLLAYFLPYDDARLVDLIDHQRKMRSRRARSIVERLDGLGVEISIDAVSAQTESGIIGRPHVARALVDQGAAADVNDAFRKYLGANRPAYVPKELPDLAEVTSLVRSLGGVSAAAHLRSRATRATLIGLKAAGVDAVEVLHPAHTKECSNRISALAVRTGLLRTGGSDWHGETAAEDQRAVLGGVQVPDEWLVELERLHEKRAAASGNSTYDPDE